MGITATVTLTCDNCDQEEICDLENSESPEDVVDKEGWYLTTVGISGDRLMCEDCYSNDEDN